MSEDEVKALRGGSMLVGLVALLLWLVALATWVASIWSVNDTAAALRVTALTFTVVGGVFAVMCLGLWHASKGPS